QAEPGRQCVPGVDGAERRAEHDRGAAGGKDRSKLGMQPAATGVVLEGERHERRADRGARDREAECQRRALRAVVGIGGGKARGGNDDREDERAHPARSSNPRTARNPLRRGRGASGFHQPRAISDYMKPSAIATPAATMTSVSAIQNPRRPSRGGATSAVNVAGFGSGGGASSTGVVSSSSVSIASGASGSSSRISVEPRPNRRLPAPNSAAIVVATAASPSAMPTRRANASISSANSRALWNRNAGSTASAFITISSRPRG